jgi:hypothetical protein
MDLINNKYAIEPIQLRAFFSDFATIERTLRKILKENEMFKLPKEAELKRKLLQNKFAQQYANKSNSSHEV